MLKVPQDQAQGGGTAVQREDRYASLVERAANDSDGVLI